MTRAKDDLHLVVPQRFFAHGQHAQVSPPVCLQDALHSRKLLGLFERTFWPIALAGTAARSASQGPRWTSAPACAECGGSRKIPK